MHRSLLVSVRRSFDQLSPSALPNEISLHSIETEEKSVKIFVAAPGAAAAHHTKREAHIAHFTFPSY